MSKIVFGYWKVRGLGQYLRQLLAYSQLEFEEVQYKIDNPDKWFKEEKFSLGLDFPNVPYLIDGDFKLTESSAIAKYIIRKSGKIDLLGRTVQDQGKVNNFLGVFQDAFTDMRGIIWVQDYKNLKDGLMQKNRPKFEYMKQFVGNREFALGYLTLIDFYLSEMLYRFQALYPKQKENYSFWWRIRKNVEALPGVQAYYNRPDAHVLPFFPSYVAVMPKLSDVKLAYWDIRGLAQTCRLLLAYSGVEFEDIRYTNRDKWFNEEKFNLGLDFPNLPYLMDGDYSITESTAIQRYIINRWGKKELLGKNIQDNAQIESIISVLYEASYPITALFFNKNYETAKGPILEKYRGKFDQLNKFVGEKNFAMGYLTLADFIIAEDSYFIERMYPQEYKSWPFLQRIRENLSKLPEIVAYYEKPTAFKGKFLPQFAVLAVEQKVEEKEEQKAK